MKSKDFLILFFNNANEENLFLDLLNKYPQIESDCTFKWVNRFFRIIRRIHFKSNLPGTGIWLNKWKKDIYQKKCIICNATYYSPKILKWIRKKNSKVKLINYYWDIIEISKYPIKKSKDFSNWSFNKKDCIQYKMNYNPQFYLNTMYLSKVEVIYDIVYVGAEHVNRRKILEKYIELFKKMNLKYFLYLVTPCIKADFDIYHKEKLDEKNFNYIMSQGKAILEIIDAGFEWETQRPLLALSNNKKLITNNINIKREKYYSPDNIFILGSDNEKDLIGFLNKPFKTISADIMNYYNVEEWIQRF
ncbi:MAG: hypothetical protein HFH65_07830 [Lachnospiraceae bacterium]|nr:hypothetical protein [Lachnospiraceae bacterium]